MRVLGLDMGERRIGVALSDPSGTLASPLTTLTRTTLARDLAAIVRLLNDHEAERIVAGIPVSLDGQLHKQGQTVLAFVHALSKESPVPVVTWDERFSTAEASRLLREAGRKPSLEREREDAAAAAVILQDYLDAQRRGSSTGARTPSQ